MGQPWVTSTAQMLCSFGLAPSSLNVLPIKRVIVEGKPAAAITDIIPIVNIPPFGNCTSLANPMVAAAMLDRLLHRSVVFNIDGESYRMRTHRARVERLTKGVKPTASA